MNAKKLLISTALIASLAMAGTAALAQDDGTSSDSNPPTTQGWNFPGGRGPRNGDGFMGRGQRGPMNGPQGRGQFGNQPGMHLQGIGVLDLAEQYTGLTLSELRDARDNGQTLAELIAANGKSVDDFVAAATENAATRIDTAVENGRITSDQAATLKAQMEERVTAMVNGEQGPIISVIQEYTGLDLAGVRDAHQNGQTLADMITANGKNVDDFVAAVTDEVNARIDQAVTNGFITTERAEQLKTAAQARITAHLNGDFGPMGPIGLGLGQGFGFGPMDPDVNGI